MSSSGGDVRGETSLRRVSFRWALLYGAAQAGIGIHDVWFNAVAGFFLRGYGLSNMAVGFLANERSFIGSVLVPVAGAVSDRLTWRWGRRKPFMLLIIPVAAGFLLLMGDPPQIVVVAVFVLGPICMGLGSTAYQVLLPDVVVEEQRGTVNGLTRALAFIGGIALLVVAAGVWESQPDVVFLLVAASLMVGLAITMLGVKEAPPPPAESQPPVRWQPWAYLKDVLEYRAAAWYVVAYFSYWVGMGGITPFITRFAHEELGIPQQETFILLLAVMFGTLLAVGPAGWLGDKVGKKRVTQWGLFCFAVIILIGSQVQTREQVVGIMALAGLAQAVPTALAYPLFTELVPARRMGELSGLSTMVWSLAQPLGATAFGLLADREGTLRVVLLCGGLSIALSWALLLKVHDRRATVPLSAGQHLDE